MSKSTKKHIRREKARIRREVFDVKEQKQLIEKLYQPAPVSHEQKEVKVSKAPAGKTKKKTSAPPKNPK